MPDFTREESWVQHVEDLSAKQSATTVGKHYPHEMVEKLIKAVFAAGFRCGHQSGSDEATAFEQGYYPKEPQDSDAAWQYHVRGASYKPLDIFSPEAWEDVP